MGGLLHRIAHFFSWNTGRVVSHTDEQRNIWIGFQCDQCGQVSDAHIAQTYTRSKEDQHHDQ